MSIELNKYVDFKKLFGDLVSEKFEEMRSASMKQAVDGNVILSTNTEYTDFVKELSDDEFEYFRNILLKQELYEEVNNMINIRG